MDLNQTIPSILDLSQRTTNSNELLDHWSTNIPCQYSDTIDEDTFKIDTGKDFHIEQPLTDQYRDIPKKDDSLSDTSQSKLDSYSSSSSSSSRKKPW